MSINGINKRRGEIWKILFFSFKPSNVDWDLITKVWRNRRKPKTFHGITLLAPYLRFLRNKNQPREELTMRRYRFLINLTRHRKIFFFVARPKKRGGNTMRKTINRRCKLKLISFCDHFCWCSRGRSSFGWIGQLWKLEHSRDRVIVSIHWWLDYKRWDRNF